MDLQSKIAEAAAFEAATGKPMYIVKSDCGYIILDRMPMMGEWYTSDGIRHG